MTTRTADPIDQLGTLAAQIVTKFMGSADEATMVALLDPIEEDAPQRQATTPRGALFQLQLAAADVGELVGTEGWDEDALHARVERIEAAIVSALNVFERACGLDRDEIGGAYFCGRGYAPQLWQRRERNLHGRANGLASPDRS